MKNTRRYGMETGVVGPKRAEKPRFFREMTDRRFEMLYLSTRTSSIRRSLDSV